MSKVTSQQQGKWDDLVNKNYADQAIWFLNGFWEELEGEAENLWHFAELFAELDTEKKADGNELDEFWSHKFLERLGETLTVIALRERMKTIDVDFNKRMSMTEYLIFRYKKTIQQVIDAPQGDNKEEIAEAQAKVEAAQKAVDEMIHKLEEQKAAVAAAKAAADESRAAASAAKAKADAAKAAEDEAKRTADIADKAAADATAKEEAAKDAAEKARIAAEEADKAAAPYRAAVAENEAALAELRAQEEAYNGKIAELEKKSQEGGVVQRNRAANELQQLKAEDPLPLRRAKINQQATVRKMEKAAAPFNEASEKANAAAEVSKEAAQAASQAADVAREEKAKADAAAAEAEAAFKEAEAASQAADAAAKAADEAAEAAEEAKRQVEAAVAEAEASLKEALDFLEAAKSKGGVAHGAIWWMERTIEEKKKYLPGYKGKKF